MFWTMRLAIYASHARSTLRFAVSRLRLLEPVQSSFPQLTTRGQPVFSDLEPFGRDLIRPHSPALLRLDQVASFEHREVLHKRWELHVERRRQFAHSGWSD